MPGRCLGSQPESVHLVITSPPYWTLKEYHRSKGQIGYISDYDQFLRDLTGPGNAVMRR